MDKATRVNSYMPALDAMGGLTTAPFLLYKIFGFEVLHVRFPPPLRSYALLDMGRSTNS